MGLDWVGEPLNDTGGEVRAAQSDGSSDKHTGNERERLMDSTRLLLMGSGLTWLMAGALKRERARRTEAS